MMFQYVPKLTFRPPALPHDQPQVPDHAPWRGSPQRHREDTQHTPGGTESDAIHFFPYLSISIRYAIHIYPYLSISIHVKNA